VSNLSTWVTWQYGLLAASALVFGLAGLRSGLRRAVRLLLVVLIGGVALGIVTHTLTDPVERAEALVQYARNDGAWAHLDTTWLGATEVAGSSASESNQGVLKIGFLAGIVWLGSSLTRRAALPGGGLVSGLLGGIVGALCGVLLGICLLPILFPAPGAVAVAGLVRMPELVWGSILRAHLVVVMAVIMIALGLHSVSRRPTGPS